MLRKYSFFGIPLEMYLVMGIFVLLLLGIVGYALLEQRRLSKRTPRSLKKESRS